MSGPLRRIVLITVAASCFIAALMLAALRGPLLNWRIAGASSRGRIIRHAAGVAAPPASGGAALQNIAPLATVSVSSARDEAPESAEGVADGVPDVRDWIASGESEGAWLRLDWDRPATVTEVDLYDLPNPRDNIIGGSLSFDDGSVVPVAPLPPDGKPRRLVFAPKTIRSVTFRIDHSEGGVAGLAEIMVMGSFTPAQ